MRKKDFVFRFAGEGGQGQVTSAELMAQVTAQVGYYVKTYATFPSQIVGGPTWAQTRISTDLVLSYGDEVDVLVAFNRDAYNEHRSEVRDEGVIIYNSEEFDLEGESNSLGIRVDELAKSTGNPRAANMVILGAIAHLINMPEHYLPDFVTKRFTRGRPGDEEIIRANIQALSLGREEAAKSGFNLGELEPPNKPEGEQILIKGNDALAIGALAGGVDFFIGYPISPATTILQYMERNLVGPGKFVYQASSEIEAVNAIVGGGYAGKKAMTSTAGPGFSLMSEGVGLAWMAEIPIVIVDVQRGGPATGLPTKTEQSDLLAALHPAHGDVKLPVIAVGTVEECFEGAIAALNWAERYQGPVILLSDHALSEQAQNIPKPDLSKVVAERRQVYQGQNGYLRYDSWELSPMPIPGGPGSYVANASEHDSVGDTTHLPSRHIQMTERRFSKLKLLEDGTYERENAKESIALLPWGGSKGPAREAYDALIGQGQRIAWYYTMFLHPMPPKLVKELKQKELVMVPELNYLGQLSSILRSQGIRAESITQYNGRPFMARDLVARVTERIASQKKELVQV
ncbi:MAG: 2-oxoacid:acceptor oxidoreductase subunit alpha [Chloroflexi bacterium]|nr:2-oxoacid:acceptor oxidoreductase subunit alpha [Chloroflexota bacterium]